MIKPKRIFIIGHMGTGKFIFTEALAKQLQWQIIDANPSIERYIGRQTKDILGEAGEVAFNQSQADIIRHAMAQDNIVVLLEECVASSEQCRKLLSSEFVVYLKTDIPTQIGRMKNGRKPALPVTSMEALLTEQHQARDVFYEEMATVTVDSVGFSDDIAEINKVVMADVHKVLQSFEN